MAKKKAVKKTLVKKVVAKKVKPKSASAKSKKLTKSSSDKMISGVIGGISEYIGIDSTILRLAWIAMVAFTGFVPGVLAYGLAALVMPER